MKFTSASLPRSCIACKGKLISWNSALPSFFTVAGIAAIRSVLRWKQKVRRQIRDQTLIWVRSLAKFTD